MCDVSGSHGFPSFKIRPKAMSMHGRQYIKDWNNNSLFNIGKLGKLKSMSLRPNFVIGRGDDTDPVYNIVADMMGRTISLTNERGELVMVMAKTNKALLMNAAFGAGSESSVDVAPGVDVSFALAVVFGLQQVGAHFASDAFSSYVVNPATNAVTDNVTETLGLGGAVNEYSNLSNDAFNTTNQLMGVGNFIRNNFFS
jgi:hypothetical protein